MNTYRELNADRSVDVAEGAKGKLNRCGNQKHYLEELSIAIKIMEAVTHSSKTVNDPGLGKQSKNSFCDSYISLFRPKLGRNPVPMTPNAGNISDLFDVRNKYEADLALIPTIEVEKMLVNNDRTTFATWK